MNVNKIRKNILLFPFLYFLSIIYRIITDIRNLCYNTGIFKIHKYSIPIISVGNITTGGTGKTPFIIYLIEKFNGLYKNIAVVSRGYGRESKGLQIVSDGDGNIVDANVGGDEPVLIAGKFPNIPVIVSEDRKKGIELAVDKYNADLVLLDDAFQHRKVHRACDIVLVNANYPISKDKILPLGNLREGANSLNRADFILITKIDNTNNIQDQIDYLKNFKSEVFLAKYSNSNITKLNLDSEKNIVDLKDTPIIAFSGIADPDSFKLDLQKSGLILKEFMSFKDHKKYEKKEIYKLINVAENHKCKNIVTTEKDLVKLNMKNFEKYNLFVVAMKIEVLDEKMFLKKIQKCIDLTI